MTYSVVWRQAVLDALADLYVALSLDDEEAVEAPKAHTPPLSTLRNFLIRVIGRLEAARP